MSAIEWTEKTWNPVTGCDIVSKGCKGCYAMAMAARLEVMNPQLEHYHGLTKKVNGTPVWTGKIGIAPKATLEKPLRWKKPQLVFVNSMSDLFHKDVPDETRDLIFDIMERCPQHTFQILTKRETIMQRYMANRYAGINAPANIWLGVSVEDQATADQRIAVLLTTKAAIRFISYEPACGPIDLSSLEFMDGTLTPLATVTWGDLIEDWQDTEPGWQESFMDWHNLGNIPPSSEIATHKLDWVIAGGESGRRARPAHPDWFRTVRDQCAEAGVPFMFKQWGAWLPWSQFGSTEIEDDPEQTKFNTMEWKDGRFVDVGKPMWCDSADGTIDGEQCVALVGKSKAGRLLDGKLHDGYPNMEVSAL